MEANARGSCYNRLCTRRIAANDSQRSLFYQCISHLTTGLGKQALHRATGDTHAVSSLGLGHALTVTEMQRFQLIMEQSNTLKLPQRGSGRFKDRL